MKVFVVTRPDLANGRFCVYRNGFDVIDAEFDGAEAGDSITVTLKEMTEDDLDKLPEFEGW